MYRNLSIAVLLAQSFIVGMVYQSSVYYIPLYLENAHQFSATKSALIFAPMFGVQSVASILSGLWITRYKRYGVVLRTGFALWTLYVVFAISRLSHCAVTYTFHPAVLV